MAPIESNPNPTETDPLVKKKPAKETTFVDQEQQKDDDAKIIVRTKATVWDDAVETLALGAPIFLAMLSWVGMKTTDSALLGHVSADALAASSLADLWTMCTAVLIQARVLGVLTGAAVGAGNPHLAGIYLQVSFVILGCIVVFIMICWYFTEAVWVAFGSDPVIAKMSGYYARVLAWSLPGQMLFTQTSQFFSSQKIMHPEMVASVTALGMNLLFGLIFVLGIFVPDWSGYGFTACPLVTTGVVYGQWFVLWFFYIYLGRLHETAWDGWKWSEITWERIKTFSDLYFPAALGLASDFWRVAVVGAVAAKLGEVQVAVFNTSYRIMWIVLIMSSALSSASGIQITMRLGNLDHKGARQAGITGVTMCALFLIVIGGIVVTKIRYLGLIFTQDEEFLDLFEESAWPFTCTLVFMNLSVALERIPYSQGRTKQVFWLGFVASWGAQVPAVILLTKYWRDDLTGLYWGMAVGYIALAILYGFICITSDWKKYAELARQRSEVSDKDDAKGN